MNMLAKKQTIIQTKISRKKSKSSESNMSIIQVLYNKIKLKTVDNALF